MQQTFFGGFYRMNTRGIVRVYIRDVIVNWFNIYYDLIILQPSAFYTSWKGLYIYFKVTLHW